MKLLFKRSCDNVLYYLMSNGDLIMPYLDTKLLRKGTRKVERGHSLLRQKQKREIQSKPENRKEAIYTKCKEGKDMVEKPKEQTEVKRDMV
jgi:hypothetical protein